MSFVLRDMGKEIEYWGLKVGYSGKSSVRAARMLEKMEAESEGDEAFEILRVHGG